MLESPRSQKKVVLDEADIGIEPMSPVSFNLGQNSMRSRNDVRVVILRCNKYSTTYNHYTKPPSLDLDGSRFNIRNKKSRSEQHTSNRLCSRSGEKGEKGEQGKRGSLASHPRLNRFRLNASDLAFPPRSTTQSPCFLPRSFSPFSHSARAICVIPPARRVPPVCTSSKTTRQARSGSVGPSLRGKQYQTSGQQGTWPDAGVN